MFIGHFAVGLAGKHVAPRASLGTLFLAAEFLDALGPIFLAAGLEHARIRPGGTAFAALEFTDYPISHSLATSLGWSLAFAAVYFLLRRDRRTSLVLAGVVFSHWLLDALSHLPDLPLAPGVGHYVGLGLWNSVPLTIAVETALYLAGLALYLGATCPRDRIGQVAFWILVALLYAIYLGNIFGPPPPSIKAFQVSAFGLWIFVFWAYWVDRHRGLSPSPPGGRHVLVSVQR